MRQRPMQTRRSKNEAGFSLLEVIFAMGITITMMGLASTLLAGSFNVRSREISNSGLKLPSGLPAVSTNGVVTDDTDNLSLRFVSNLNGMPDSANGYFEDSDVDDQDEDIKFLMYVDASIGQRYIVRYEKNGGTP